MPSVLEDQEFGPITIRRTRLARSIRLRVNHDGQVSISMPKRAPLYLAKQLLEQARPQIRRNIVTTEAQLTLLRNGDLIGKSHRLIITEGSELTSRLVDTTLHVTVPGSKAIDSRDVQTFIKQAALKALRKQASAYLTRRLTNLAAEHGFHFSDIRFSNAGTRWGSCSTRGTISLNIWLMQLPFELIDYVLIHELCHTVEMNHSPRFWTLVENLLPNYRDLRRSLRTQHPYL
jgi:predicted metal-dependent hydrolase